MSPHAVRAHLWVLHKAFKTVNKVGAVEGVATNTNNSGLPETCDCCLIDGLQSNDVYASVQTPIVAVPSVMPVHCLPHENVMYVPRMSECLTVRQCRSYQACEYNPALARDPGSSVAVRHCTRQNITLSKGANAEALHRCTTR